VEGLLAGFHRQAAEIPVGKGPERRLAGANDGDWSHIISLAEASKRRQSAFIIPRFPGLRVNFGVGPVKTVFCERMSEVVEPGLELAEWQNRFVSEHLRRIFVQIYRIVRNAADAQDLTQEAFIKALQHQEQLKDEQKAAHWLSRIATNTAIDFMRRNGRVTFCQIEDAPESHTETPEDVLLRSEQRNYLEDGLRLLTPRERAALMLRDVEGLPAEEVAKQLDCSKATVRSHIANARTKFRRYMERRKL
jgi:RNA polymerase sigma-70 factor (ECF subfamily)